MAAFKRLSSTDSSVRKLASPDLWEAETFFAEGTALRIVSQICASHIEHIMPSIFNVVLIIVLSSPFLYPQPFAFLLVDAIRRILSERQLRYTN